MPIPALLWMIFIAELSAILIGFAFYRHMDRPYRVVHIQVILAFTVEVIGRILMENKHSSNMWVFNIYMLLEVVLLITAAYYLINKISFKKYFVVLLLCSVLGWFVMCWIKGLMVTFSAYFISYSLLLLILYLYAIGVNHVFKAGKIYKQPMFVLLLSVLIYFGGVIPLFSVINSLNSEHPVLARRLFYINKWLVVLRYSLVAVSFLLCVIQAKKMKYVGE